MVQGYHGTMVFCKAPLYHTPIVRTIEPWSYLTVKVWYHGAKVSYYNGIAILIMVYHIIIVQLLHGAVVPRPYDTLMPWYHGMYHGAIVARYHGIMV